MSGYLDWEPKTASEVVVRYADFTDELNVAGGEHLTSVVVAATVYSGNDPAPAAIVSGSQIIDNSAGVESVVAVTLQAGGVGTLYQCVVTGTSSLGQQITKTAVLAVKPPLV